MSRFGLRNKVMGAFRRALGNEDDSPAPWTPSEAPPPVPPRTRPPAPASSARPPVADSPAAPSLGAKAKEPSSEPAPSTGLMWVQLAGVRPDEVLPGSVHQVEVFGSRFALYKSDDGDFFATFDSCPHAGGPLGEGDLNGHVVTCPFHAFEFDVRDGKCTSGAELTVKTAALKVEDDMVFLEVSQ